MSHDIIGDIHGHADRLEALLDELGYEHRNGAWRHPSRTAIFVGDFVDRGPGQLRTLELARAMIEAGSARATMGNHEFNAIAWATPDPESDGHHLRPRGIAQFNQCRVRAGSRFSTKVATRYRSAPFESVIATDLATVLGVEVLSRREPVRDLEARLERVPLSVFSDRIRWWSP